MKFGPMGNLAKLAEDAFDLNGEKAARLAAEAAAAAKKAAEEAARLAAEEAAKKAAEEAAQLAAEEAARLAAEEAAKEAARLACNQYDTLCQLTAHIDNPTVGIWHFPQFVQNSIQWISEKTGLSAPAATGVGAGAVVGGVVLVSYLALRQKREDLAKTFCDELCQAVASDAQAVELFHGLLKEKGTVTAIRGLSKTQAGELGSTLKGNTALAKQFAGLGAEGRQMFIDQWKAAREEEAKANTVKPKTL